MSTSPIWRCSLPAIGNTTIEAFELQPEGTVQIASYNTKECGHPYQRFVQIEADTVNALDLGGYTNKHQ